MRSIRAFALLLGAMAVASDVSAQGLTSPGTWVPIGTPNQGSGAFWDNPSDDGPNCNIGFILRGTNGACSYQVPPGFLATLGTPIPSGGSYRQQGGFTFTPGAYAFQLYGGLYTLPGTVGVFDAATRSLLTTLANPSGPLTVNASGNWVFGISRNGTTYYSDTNPLDFALFSPQAGGAGPTWWVGIEDIPGHPTENGGDFQDRIIRVSAVPEPATVALLAMGLVGLSVATLRRQGVSRTRTRP